MTVAIANSPKALGPLLAVGATVDDTASKALGPLLVAEPDILTR